MKEKHRALLMLGLGSFLLPIGEVLVLKYQRQPSGMYALVQAVLLTYAVYWWYVVDKRERQFRAGLNMGVVLLSVVALPIYFVRSRGWGRGALASLAMLGVAICAVVLIMLGEATGRAIAF